MQKLQNLQKLPNVYMYRLKILTKQSIGTSINYFYSIHFTICIKNPDPCNTVTRYCNKS